MKHFKLYGFVFLMAAILLGFTACEESVDPDDDNNRPNAPTNLEATSVGDDALKIAWTSSTSTGANLVYHYYVYDGTTAVKDGIIEGDQNAYTITGLQTGIAYDIMLYSEYEGGERSSTAAEITWSTANRYQRDDQTNLIRLYTWSTTQFGSGINVNDASGYPKQLKVASMADWDLAFYDNVGTFKQFGSASEALKIDGKITASSQLNSVTEIGDVVYFANSLNDVLHDVPLDDITDIVFQEALFDLADQQFLNNTGNVVFIVRTRDQGDQQWHYSKVMVKRDAGDNDFVHGSGSGAYLELEISLNPEAGLPYAK